MGFGRMDDRMIWFFKCIRKREKKRTRGREIICIQICANINTIEMSCLFSLKTCTDKANNITQV